MEWVGLKHVYLRPECEEVESCLLAVPYVFILGSLLGVLLLWVFVAGDEWVSGRGKVS